MHAPQGSPDVPAKYPEPGLPTIQNIQFNYAPAVDDNRQRRGSADARMCMRSRYSIPRLQAPRNERNLQICPTAQQRARRHNLGVRTRLKAYPHVLHQHQGRCAVPSSHQPRIFLSSSTRYYIIYVTSINCNIFVILFLIIVNFESVYCRNSFLSIFCLQSLR